MILSKDIAIASLVNKLGTIERAHYYKEARKAQANVTIYVRYEYFSIFNSYKYLRKSIKG